MLNRAALLILVLLVAAGTAAAQGLVIPTEPDLPPLALTKHHVRVEVDNQAAVTTVEQDFLNNTERQLEAQYVFPIPKGAAVTKFTMLVNGKETSGEMVEKNRARQIYNQIVSRAQDPGLLEYLGNDVFRANIFPVLPRSTQKITVRFEQVLAAEGNLVSYVYPVRQGMKRGPTVNGEFKIDVAIRSAIPVLSVYSPSHRVAIERNGEREAKVSYAERSTTLAKDFQLYYSVSDKDIGLNLVTYRPDPAEPGYYMMLISPRSRLQAERIVERDIVFVVDTSGSMAGEKIQQAKNALKYCISNLNDGDRFAIVQFSTETRAWKKDFVGGKEYREAAQAWIDRIEAAGGTNISEAIDAAFAYPKDAARPFFVIFMTDGKPTISVTDPKAILQQVEKSRGDSTRIFTWGVGYDVDTQLLDAIASLAGGVSEYVHPEEDIASKVANFYGKTSHPVLTNLELVAIGEKVRLEGVYPKTLPDLYAGGQLVALGRYTGEGDVALQLKGRVNDQTDTITYEARFAASELKNHFIESLWAKRRIGFLLDEIRLRGESKELVDEAIRLSVEHGIQTPYTSYLILEDGTPVSAAPSGGAGGGWRGVPQPGAKAPSREEAKKLEQKLDGLTERSGEKPSGEPSPADEADRRKHNEEAESLAKGFKDKGGKAAVDTAGYLRRLKEAEGGESDAKVLFRKAAGARFYLYRGMWVDERYQSDSATTLVKFGSEAYFKLVETHPELKDAFKLGTSILLATASGKAVVIGPEGEEKLTDDQAAELFQAVKK